MKEILHLIKALSLYVPLEVYITSH